MGGEGAREDGRGEGGISLEQGRVGLKKELLCLFSKSSLTLESCRRHAGKDIIITICIPLEIQDSTAGRSRGAGCVRLGLPRQWVTETLDEKANTSWCA